MKEKRKTKVFASIEKPEPIIRDDFNNYFNNESIIYWYINSSNLFPNKLLRHYLKASLFSPIIQEITAFFTGAGFESDNIDIKKIIDSANEKESLRTIFGQLQFNHNLTGNAFLLLSWDDSGKWIKFWNEHSINCRLSKDKKSVIIKQNWEYNEDKGQKIGLFPKISRKKGIYYSFIHIKKDIPGFPDYAPPYWIAGLNNSEIPYKITDWNRNRIDNGFSVDGFYMNPNMEDHEIESQELVNKINDIYSGKEGRGKLIMISGEGKIELLDKLFEMDWTKFYSQSKYLIHKDLRFPSSLMGDYGEKGFSKDKGMTDYSLFKPFMLDMQDIILEPIKKTINEITGFDTSDLTILNNNPFAQEDKKIENKDVMTINEKRIINELEPIPGGDAIYMSSSLIPAIEKEESK